MSLVKIIQDISENNTKLENDWDFLFPNYSLLSNIYRHSVIDIEQYYHDCALISKISSNNQKVLDSLEYYVFRNMITYYKKIQDDENGTSNSGDENSQIGDVRKMQQNMMSGTGNMFKNMKSNIPKIK